MLSQISLGQLLALMDPSVRDRVIALARKPGTTHLVFFENNSLDSSHLGESTVVAIGPNHTYKSVAEVQGKWLHDLPSQRQYPQYWCEAEETDSHAANWCPICSQPVRFGTDPNYRSDHIHTWEYREGVPPTETGSKSRHQKTGGRR